MKGEQEEEQSFPIVLLIARTFSVVGSEEDQH